MTDAQLRDWLDACTKMELHVKPAGAPLVEVGCP